MAQNYRCDVCQDVAADFMITDIRDGEVTAVGVECLLDWALPIAEAYQAAVAHSRGEAGDPGTVNVTALDPPDDGTVEAPQELQEPSEGSDAEWEQSARPRAKGARKRGSPASADVEREDTQAEAAAHERG